jgi:tRNA dimethylallyltransferase
MSDILVITGQTATGKTDAAIEIAKEQHGEIICADSRQVYNYLDIVTGKDKGEFKDANIPVWGLDLIDPTAIFSSHEFVEYATEKIREIKARGNKPIIVGGSYLYVKHLLYGFDVHVAPDDVLRSRLEQRSVEQLQTELASLFDEKKIVNPMNQSDWNNPRRLIRKIEILNGENNKKKIQDENGISFNYSIEIIGFIHKHKESLREKIELRVQNRIEQGAIIEVQNVLDRGFKREEPGLNTIGCKQIIAFLNDELTEEELKIEWLTREVQYAKRQYTFMKQNASIEWREV